MKKTIITMFLILTLITCMFSFKNVSYADDTQSASFSLTANQSNWNVGDTIEVNIVINSLTGFSGINTFIAKKNFDSTTFEYITTEGKDGWQLKGDDSKIVLRKESGESSTGIIATMKFKVLKTDITSKIQLTELDVAGDDGDVYYDDGNVNSPYLSVEQTNPDVPDTNPENPGTNPENPDTNPENPGTNTEEPTTNTQKPTTNTNKPANNDKTTSSSQIPQTGDNYTIISLIIVAVVIAVVVYARYKKIGNDIK